MPGNDKPTESSMRYGSHKARGEHMQLRTALCRTQKGDHLRIDLAGDAQVHEMAGTGENHLLGPCKNR